MATPATLPLSEIVDVTVLIAPQAPAAPQFNQALIIGNSGVIPTSGANSRVRKYLTLAQMLTDGFSTSDPEYIAAQIYLSQVPAPQNGIWIGAQDPGGLNTLNITSGGHAGTGYQVGDILTVVQGGASGGTLQVVTLGGSGAVATFVVLTAGTGYTVGTALTTTGGHGTGLEVDITMVGESALLAAIACRTASLSWYLFMVTDAVDADHLALAGFAQTATPNTVYIFSTADANVLNNVTNNILQELKALNYNRVMGWYNTTQSGVFPNNIYAAAAVMGLAMGLNTGLANSYYTMALKQLVGITTEPLTPTQVGNPTSQGGGGILGNNGNLYLSYGSQFSVTNWGTMANGQFFDEIINLDMLVANIGINVMDLLISVPALPQTDVGETQLLQVVSAAAEQSRQIGFIAGGTWEGVQILKLVQGDTLGNGYLAQAAPYSTQAPTDRAARKAMPIYLAIIEAGAVHFVTIGVYVQR